MANYISPKRELSAFTCPHCNTLSQMKMGNVYVDCSGIHWERLCNELGETGPIDKMIGSLVKKGLSATVQKALDAVRVLGNKAVHPGQISFDVDDKSTAETLMKLLNIITERLITEPKEIDSIFDALPESTKEAIENRDK